MEDQDAIEVIRQLEAERRLVVPDWPCVVATYSRVNTPSGFRAQMQQPDHRPPRSAYALASPGVLEHLEINQRLFRAIVWDAETGGLKGTTLKAARDLLAVHESPPSTRSPRSRRSGLAG